MFICLAGEGMFSRMACLPDQRNQIDVTAMTLSSLLPILLSITKPVHPVSRLIFLMILLAPEWPRPRAEHPTAAPLQLGINALPLSMQ